MTSQDFPPGSNEHEPAGASVQYPSAQDPSAAFAQDPPSAASAQGPDAASAQGPDGASAQDADGVADPGRAAGPADADEPTDETDGALVAALMEIDRHLRAAYLPDPAGSQIGPSHGEDARPEAPDTGAYASGGRGAAGAQHPFAPRLFALVLTDTLMAAAPELAGQVPEHRPDALSSVEQDDFEVGDDLLSTLTQVSWPPMVSGCALALVQEFLPAELSDRLPSDRAAARAFVHEHPRRQQASVVLGVMRDGRTHGLARLHDHPDQLLGAPDLVPGLTRVLARTLQ